MNKLTPLPPGLSWGGGLKWWWGGSSYSKALPIHCWPNVPTQSQPAFLTLTPSILFQLGPSEVLVGHGWDAVTGRLISGNEAEGRESSSIKSPISTPDTKLSLH